MTFRFSFPRVRKNYVNNYALGLSVFTVVSQAPLCVEKRLQYQRSCPV